MPFQQHEKMDAALPSSSALAGTQNGALHCPTCAQCLPLLSRARSSSVYFLTQNGTASLAFERMNIPTLKYEIELNVGTNTLPGTDGPFLQGNALLQAVVLPRLPDTLRARFAGHPDRLAPGHASGSV